MTPRTALQQSAQLPRKTLSQINITIPHYLSQFKEWLKVHFFELTKWMHSLFQTLLILLQILSSRLLGVAFFNLWGGRVQPQQGVKLLFKDN